jgi:hypothetical protein
MDAHRGDAAGVGAGEQAVIELLDEGRGVGVAAVDDEDVGVRLVAEEHVRLLRPERQVEQQAARPIDAAVGADGAHGLEVGVVGGQQAALLQLRRVLKPRRSRFRSPR